MRGVPGAIDHVWTEHGTIQCSTIGAVESRGICGSGLIDAVAVLLELGLINARGRIQSTDELDGQRIIRLAKQIYLTQEDIRAVQMAKGAIAAGIVLMAAHLDISVSQIECVYLAGAFGNFLNSGNACRIGLLPPELRGKTISVGNAAGSGARMMVCDQALFQAAGEAIEHIEFLEFSGISKSICITDEVSFMTDWVSVALQPKFCSKLSYTLNFLNPLLHIKGKNIENTEESLLWNAQLP